MRFLTEEDIPPLTRSTPDQLQDPNYVKVGGELDKKVKDRGGYSAAEFDALKTTVPKDIGTAVYKKYTGTGKPSTTSLKAITGFNYAKWAAQTLVNLLNIGYLDKSRPFMVLGSAGIGKSTIIENFTDYAAAKEGRKKLEFTKTSTVDEKTRIDIISDPSQYYILFDFNAPSINLDWVGGVPDMDKSNKQGYLINVIPHWVKLVTNPNFSGMIFIDEINRVQDRSVLNYFLMLTLKRVAGERPLSNGAQIVAAGNIGAEFESSTSEMDPALRSRFAGGVLVLEPEEWIHIARKIGVSEDIIKFVEANPQKNLYGGFSKDEEKKGIPINPRQLVAASNHLQIWEAAYYLHHERGLPLPYQSTGKIFQDIRNTLEGDVGYAWTNEFMEFLQINKSFSWVDILAAADAGQFKSKGNQKAELEISHSMKYSIAKHATDKIIKDYNDAQRAGDEAKKKEILDILYGELYRLCLGFDSDQGILILTNIYDRIMSVNPATNLTQDQLKESEALKRWSAVANAILLKSKAQNPEFFEKFKNFWEQKKQGSDMLKN